MLCPIFCLHAQGPRGGGRYASVRKNEKIGPAELLGMDLCGWQRIRSLLLLRGGGVRVCRSPQLVSMRGCESLCRVSTWRDEVRFWASNDAWREKGRNK